MAKPWLEGVGSATLAANPSGGVFVAFGGAFADPDGIRIQSFDAEGNARWPGEGGSGHSAGGSAKLRFPRT